MTVPKIRLGLARKLKKERLKAKLTQEKMAELIGVSTRFYQMLESQKPTAVPVDTLEKIAKALKISPSKLLDF